MKIKLFIILLCISFSSFSQYEKKYKEIKTSISNTITDIDTSSVTKSIYNDVKSVVKSVASGLGIASERVYEVYTKKFFIEGISNLILMFIVIILFIFSLNKSIKLIDEFYTPALIIISIFFAMCVFYFLANLPETLNKIINPEYYTIQEIINQLKLTIKQ